MVKIQNGPIGAKIVSIVCASIVLVVYVISFYCATLPPPRNHLIYVVEI